jgi:hypothetical protein
MQSDDRFDEKEEYREGSNGNQQLRCNCVAHSNIHSDQAIR